MFSEWKIKITYFFLIPTKLFCIPYKFVTVWFNCIEEIIFTVSLSRDTILQELENEWILINIQMLYFTFETIFQTGDIKKMHLLKKNFHRSNLYLIFSGMFPNWYVTWRIGWKNQGMVLGKQRVPGINLFFREFISFEFSMNFISLPLMFRSKISSKILINDVLRRMSSIAWIWIKFYDSKYFMDFLFICVRRYLKNHTW